MCGEREKVSVRDSDANSPLPMENSRYGSALRGASNRSTVVRGML